MGFAAVHKVRAFDCCRCSCFLTSCWSLQERPTLFRRFTTLHLIVTLAAFAIAAVWIALSAARHGKAVSACKTNFFGTDSALEDEGNTLCDIFPWADVGIMGGLFVILAIMQVGVMHTVGRGVSNRHTLGLPILRPLRIHRKPGAGPQPLRLHV